MGKSRKNSDDINTLMAKLIDIRSKHEMNDDLPAAHRAHTQIENLVSQKNNLKKSDTEQQHQQSIVALEDAFQHELVDFNRIWEMKIVRFTDHTGKLKQMLEERQATEHQEYMAKTRAECPPRQPKWSSQLLKLKGTKNLLVSNKKYAEGQRLHVEIQELEKKEHRQWYDNRQKKIEKLEDAFKNRQGLELNGLQKRIDSGLTELTRARKFEQERLLRRYHNVKGELQSQQRIAAKRDKQYSNAIENPSVGYASTR